jgi:putative ABC transport system permease protein
MREFWSKLRAWTNRQAVSDDLAEELRSHLEMEADDRGVTPEQARARFGNSTQIAEKARDAWGFPALESLLKDVRYGFRAMRRSPGFALVVILTFALGVGVNTAMFSVIHAVLLKPLPYPDSERLVVLSESTGKANGISVTWANFENWRASNHTFEDMAAYLFASMTMTGRVEPVVTNGLSTTPPYFTLLGMHPLLGRFFGEADDQPGAAATVVLNHSFWATKLGGDPRVVGTTITLNGNPYEVVGVADPLWEPWRVDYYLPLSRTISAADRTKHGSIRVLARLKPGVEFTAARAELDAILIHLAEAEPGPENGHRSFGEFLIAFNTGGVKGTLLLLMGAATLILLIACANVASLLLARNTSRAGELALRKAIGAGRLRLVRQLLTENAVVVTAGGLAGVVFAYWVLRLLIALVPRGIPRLAETTLNVPVLLFACGITLAAGLLAALAPVVLAGKVDITAVLKEGSRMSGAGGQRQSFRNMLVVAEVALTFVLAFGSGLLLRSLIAAQSSNPGFEPQGMLSFSLQLPPRAYRSPEAIGDFYARLLTDLRAIPGVTAANMVHCPPGAGDCGDWFYSIPGRPDPAQNDVPISLFNTAEPGYFETMRIPLREGREFGDADRASGPKVAIVNETFARTWWPGESAVGHQIKVGGPYQKGDLLEIVGVAGDVRQFGLDAKPEVEIYQPVAQRPDGGMNIVIRAAGDPVALMPSIRARVSNLDRSLPLQRLATFEQSLGAKLAGRRFNTLLLTVFAGLAMLLAAVGIYGLLSYWVTSRESEIAIRLALGARRSAIMRWTSFHVLRLAAIGVVLGVAGGWVAAKGLEDLVFGIPARSPVTMLLAGIAVAMIALAAAAIPAARAARVDPARRLHAS